ncbi:hypothetical protein CUR178_05179 [Leishmania enriettii]|uniref:Ankyrin repeat protein n=1 Tax=Leishmania enriettii TaxID=5663 RepID=A0A836HII4_LEIEN|nr:hypothetical protein CUR178_05179 [Leishmania enriettii]
MSWPLDPFVSDGGYTTPLPQQPCEAALWRAVTSLYDCSALAAPKTCWPSAAASSISPAPAGGKRVSAVEVPHAGAFAECDRVAVPCGSFSTTLSPTRAGVAEGLSAFTTADEVASPLGSSLLFSPPIASPLSPSVAAHLTNLPALHQQRLARAPTVPSLLPRSRPTGICSVSVDSLATGPTTGDIRDTCHRLLEPVQALLAQFDADKLCVGAGVVDLAVQHPVLCLRVEMVRLLLTFKRWNWSMCAPVAVAAGVGDTDVLEHLVSVEELEPNLGFPLTVAVRCYQHERVLPFLLSHPRIKPNHGAAFYVAVAIGNTEAMYILGSVAGVDVNDFANGEGTSALLYALRQLLIFSALEGAAHQPSTSAASAPLQSRGSQHVTPSSSPLSSMAQEGMATIFPLLTGWASSGDQALKHGSLSHPSGNTDNSGAASSAAARASGGTPPEVVPSKAAVPLEQRDDAPLSGYSAVGATGDGHEDAMAAVYEDDDETHSAASRQDTVANPLRTAQHWRVVLLYLLNHPAIEVNAGFYTTPLQIAVFSGNVEVVAWLLQHPRLRPDRLPRAASVLRDSCNLLRRQLLSKDALNSVVATPVEMAVQLHQREIFKLLARDQRVRLPVRLTMGLERWAWNANAIPYLTILAQHRTDWEGWGWRRRRQCVLISTAATSVVALCSWASWCVWYDSLRACVTVLMCTYAAQVVMSVILLGWETFMARTASPAAHPPVSNPVPVLVALVQHLVPAWPGTWRWGATAALLLCPGMVPLLDFLCAWSLYKFHRSRQPLQTAARAGGAAPESSLHRRPAGPSDNSARSTGLPNDPCERIDRGRRHSRWFSSTTHKRAGSSVMSSASSYDSLTDVPCAANLGCRERCSYPQPATVRTRRQAVISSGVQRRFHILSSARASATAEGAATVSAHTVATSTASRAAASGDEFASRVNSSTATNGIGVWPQARRRGSWVAPGRPSRFAVSTEYRAPDLTLRALAYATYDRILVAPRLLLSCVGIFMFMYMAFPSSLPAAPLPSAAMAEDGSAVETDGVSLLPLLAAAARNGTSARSIFTVYYHDRPLSAVPTGEAAMAVETDLANLPRFTATMGLVGLCGLVASIVSGAALLAMAFSLRTITTQSLFKSSNDMGNESDGGGDGLVLRHVEGGGPRRAANTRSG